MSLMQSINPATGKIIWEGEETTAKHVEQILKKARKAQRDWVETPLEERIALITRFKEQLDKNKEHLARIISLETGKPLWDSLTEVGAMIGKVDLSVEAYHQRTGEDDKIINGMRSRLRHRPHGVMAVFGPFNFPGHLPNGHIIPALIAGNSVVFKPSELTPMVAEETLKIWEKAGMPENLVSVMNGGPAVGQALTGSDNVDGILFTGSAKTGVAISKAVVERPWVILALELGGNNPLIVKDASDIEAAANIIIQSAFVTTGQRCTCARRLILPEDKLGDEILDAVCVMAEKLIVGAFDDEVEPFMGPLINEKAAQNALQDQTTLLSSGAKTLLEMKHHERGGAFVSPGILDVTGVKDRKDEEIFGPLLQVIRVSDFNAAIHEANNTAYGLAAGLISESEDAFELFIRQIRAGVTSWNRPTTGASSARPFGGVGRSGNHRPSAFYAADYCAYPVASLENEGSKLVKLPLPKGIKA